MPMVGLAVTIVGGEEIVGSLTAKALVNQNLMTSGGDARVIAVAGVSVGESVFCSKMLFFTE